MPTITDPSAWPQLQQTMALPIYAAALVLSYARDLLGNLAAWIAGDDLE
jgi:hypothetical protein